MTHACDTNSEPSGQSARLCYGWINCRGTRRLRGRGFGPGLKPQTRRLKDGSNQGGRRDMIEAIAEVRILVEAGMMTTAEASRIIARLEDAR